MKEKKESRTSSGFRKQITRCSLKSWKPILQDYEQTEKTSKVLKVSEPVKPEEDRRAERRENRLKREKGKANHT